MSTTLKNDRVDFASAEEVIMRHAVEKQPLLPLFEAVHNAIHASQERGLNDIIVEIEVHRGKNSLSNEIAEITGFSITDHGVGFTDDNISAFLKLFTTNKKIKYNSKGVGRLSYFSSFLDIKINSIYQVGHDFMERNFEVTISTIGLLQLPLGKTSQTNKPKTTVHICNLKQEYLQKYTLLNETLIERCKEHFAPALLSMPALKLVIHDGDNTETISKVSFCAGSQDTITVKDEQFNLFYIQEANSYSNTHAIILAAAGRVVKQEPIAFLPKTKILSQNGKKFYLKAYVISDFLNKNVDTTRSSFTGNNISFEYIFNCINSNIRKYLKQYIPTIFDVNKEMVKKIVDDLPHLSIVVNSNDVCDNLPLSSSRDKVQEFLVHEYTRKQISTLNYVKNKAKELELSKKPIAFETFMLEESEKLQDASKFNHAQLTTYVLYREFIINLFSQFLKKTPDNKYAPEAVLHNLLFPMNSSSENWESDYHKHNLWLIDDRYSTYNFLHSDQREGTIAAKKSQPTDKRYDIIAVYEDSVGGASQNVFLIELKQTHKNLSESNNPIRQIQDYVINMTQGKIDAYDGKRINISESTRFHGLVLCDIHNTYFTDYMVPQHSLQKRSDGKSYFGIANNGTLFFEVTNYENMLQIAKDRNKVFFDKLKGQ